MVQGSRVGESLRFFLFVLFCFPFCSSSHMSASIARDGVECFTLLCLDAFPFLRSSHLSFLFSLSLTSVRADLAMPGFWYLNNK